MRETERAACGQARTFSSASTSRSLAPSSPSGAPTSRCPPSAPSHPSPPLSPIPRSPPSTPSLTPRCRSTGRPSATCWTRPRCPPGTRRACHCMNPSRVAERARQASPRPRPRLYPRPCPRPRPCPYPDFHHHSHSHPPPHTGHGPGPGPRPQINLAVREHPTKGIYVDGLTVRSARRPRGKQACTLQQTLQAALLLGQVALPRGGREPAPACPEESRGLTPPCRGAGGGGGQRRRALRRTPPPPLPRLASPRFAVPGPRTLVQGLANPTCYSCMGFPCAGPPARGRAQGLAWEPCAQVLSMGDAARATASTNMNDVRPTLRARRFSASLSTFECE
jgi:hypothetical protein